MSIGHFIYVNLFEIVLFLIHNCDYFKITSNKYIEESLIRNSYGFWSEKYKLYKRSKNIIENKEKIYLLVDENEI